MGSRLGTPALALILVVGAGAGGRTARADDRTARAEEASTRFSEAMQAFEAHDYEAAIKGFEAAYELDPQPQTLFAHAQAERLSGDCPTAIHLYQRFLATEPAAKHAELARTALHRCQQALASRPDDLPPETSEARSIPPPPSAPTPAPVSPQRQSPPTTTSRSRLRDPLGGALAIAGLGGLGFGTWAYLGSRSAVDAASAAMTYNDYGRHMDRAEERRTWSLVGLGGGTALLAAAVLRYATLDRDATEQPLGTAATVAISPGSVSLVAVGRF